jgi:hypothetical protein
MTPDFGAELSASGLTGFFLEDAILEPASGPSGTRVVKLLRVTGFAGFASRGSGVTLIRRCVGCGHAVFAFPRDVSKLLEDANTERPDLSVFWPWPMHVLLSSRAADWFRRKLGARWLEAMQNGNDSDTLTPGPLASFFPPDVVDAIVAIAVGPSAHWRDWLVRDYPEGAVIREIANGPAWEVLANGDSVFQVGPGAGGQVVVTPTATSATDDAEPHSE